MKLVFVNLVFLIISQHSMASTECSSLFSTKASKEWTQSDLDLFLIMDVLSYGGKRFKLDSKLEVVVDSVGNSTVIGIYLRNPSDLLIDILKEKKGIHILSATPVKNSSDRIVEMGVYLKTTEKINFIEELTNLSFIDQM